MLRVYTPGYSETHGPGGHFDVEMKPAANQAIRCLRRAAFPPAIGATHTRALSEFPHLGGNGGGGGEARTCPGPRALVNRRLMVPTEQKTAALA